MVIAWPCFPLIDALPANEAVVWEDEANLNPRIGFDYMLPGIHRQVPTAGKTLSKVYSGRSVVHEVRDNYIIHSKRQTQLWLQEFGKKIKKGGDPEIPLTNRPGSFEFRRYLQRVLVDRGTRGHSQQTQRLWRSLYVYRFQKALSERPTGINLTHNFIADFICVRSRFC